MSSSIPSIFLDLDGTLVDSLPGITASCRAALCSLGHAPEAPLDLSGLIGPPIEEIMRAILTPLGDDRVEEGVAAYRADYRENGLYGSTPYDGIPEALATLRHSGARLYLATSKRREFAVRILENLALSDLFEAVHGSEQGGALDHKPELLAHIIERHALEPKSCVMVGDRRYDVIGARANAMRALGVLWGYGTRDELEAAGASHLVASPAKLPAAALAMAPSRLE